MLDIQIRHAKPQGRGEIIAHLSIERTHGDDAYADYKARLVEYKSRQVSPRGIVDYPANVHEAEIKCFPRTKGAMVLIAQALEALGVAPKGSHRELSLADARELKGLP